MSWNGSDVVVACVTENTPRMLAQTLRLVRSIRWFGAELAQSPVVVCAVSGIEDQSRRALESLGAEIRIVGRFHPANPTANRLGIFAELEHRREKLWLLLDCDTIVVQDPLPFLEPDFFQAKIAPLPTVTTEVFVRLFAHFGIPMPPLAHQTAFTGTPTVPYYNGGMLAMSPEIGRELAPAWRRFNRELADQPQLVDPCRRHMHQASMSLALAATRVPQRELPAVMNYQLNATHLPPPPGYAAADPVIIHYHHLAADDGQLLPCPYPRAQERIDAFNRRMREERIVAAPKPALSHQLVVLGMHRSGTSVVTELLAALGGDPGESIDLAAPDMFNPTGYWEHGEVRKLNESALVRHDADWRDLPALERVRAATDGREEFVRRAREITSRLTLVKDPRMTVLFPLWREVFAQPVCILVWRDPLAVARSLANRDSLPVPVGLALWEYYTHTALADTRDLPRVVVSYDALVADPERVGRQLVEQLEALGVREVSLPSDDRLRQIVNPDFNRNTGNVDDLLGNEHRELRDALRSGAALAGEAPPISRNSRALLDLFSDLLGERQRHAAAKRETRAHALLIEGIFLSRSWKVGHALMRLVRLFGRKRESAEDRWRTMKEQSDATSGAPPPRTRR